MKTYGSVGYSINEEASFRKNVLEVNKFTGIASNFDFFSLLSEQGLNKL